jgi:hypothetical protein
MEMSRTLISVELAEESLCPFQAGSAVIGSVWRGGVTIKGNPGSVHSLRKRSMTNEISFHRDKSS